MRKITLFGEEYTIREQESDKDAIHQKQDKILIETNKKQANALLKEYLASILYEQLSKIFKQIKHEGKIDVFGNLDFEVVEEIDNKKERVAKLRGNTILVKLNAVMLPQDVLKYVFAHEIAHTFTKRHTDGFWKIVETIQPKYEQTQTLLQEYQKKLTNRIG